jgi:hypothetical protein
MVVEDVTHAREFRLKRHLGEPAVLRLRLRLYVEAGLLFLSIPAVFQGLTVFQG